MSPLRTIFIYNIDALKLILFSTERASLITCIAEDFYPADVNMTWKKNGLPVNSTEEKADGSFEKREYHILVDTEMESEYTCEVSQEGFLNSLAENRFTKSGKVTETSSAVHGTEMLGCCSYVSSLLFTCKSHR
uniref:Ig-like domain-containing protein n=1 Tax=Erpetoichthys calabaricus TaxID=27687 RepID=A0A8C4SL95_ERPCA